MNRDDTYYLAMYRGGVQFGICDASKTFDETDLLELHIFDQNTEHRKIYSEQRGGFIEQEVFETALQGDDFFIDDDQLLFGEEVVSHTNDSLTVREYGEEFTFAAPFTENEFERGIYLKVRSYYSYDENDLLYLRSYRLCGIEVGKEEDYV